MLLTAIAIAVTVAGASVALWVVAKHELFAQVDATLQTQAVLAIRGPNNGPFGGRSASRTTSSAPTARWRTRS